MCIQEVKIFAPDYTNVDPDKAIEDFKERIKHYESVYEPLSEFDEERQDLLYCVPSFVQTVDLETKAPAI